MDRNHTGTASCYDRRTFLKTAAFGAAAVALHPVTSRGGVAPPRVSPVPFNLGVATYSLREFSRADAIAMLRTLRAQTVSVKSHHLPYEDSQEQLAAATNEFREAGIEPLSCGVVTFSEDTDDHVQQYFDYARNAGIRMIIMTAAPDILPRIERFVKSYDIAVAIHNHGPEDKYYPAPSDVLEALGDMDPRMGACVDVGHTTRTGADIVQALADSGGRLLDIHMKDLANLMDRDSQVAVGAGKMPVAAMFEQLARMNYSGSVNLEYEINKEDPLAGMIESMAYMRGVVAGMTHE